MISKEFNRLSLDIKKDKRYRQLLSVMKNWYIIEDKIQDSLYQTYVKQLLFDCREIKKIKNKN